MTRELPFYLIAAALAGLGLYLALTPTARLLARADPDRPFRSDSLDRAFPAWRRALGIVLFIAAVAAALSIFLAE